MEEKGVAKEAQFVLKCQIREDIREVLPKGYKADWKFGCLEVDILKEEGDIFLFQIVLVLDAGKEGSSKYYEIRKIGNYVPQGTGPSIKVEARDLEAFLQAFLTALNLTKLQ